MAFRSDIVNYLDELLETSRIKDDSVNGLQVQGNQEVKKVALVTDASLATYKKAAGQNAQMIIAHHGLIWHGLRTVTGPNYQHIKFLLDSNINLYASHLPLDCHPTLGNNICLANMIGLKEIEPFGSYRGLNLGFAGKLPTPQTIDVLTKKFQESIGGEPLLLSFGPKEIQSVAILSGGGSSALPEAIEKSIDCYVTGEGAHQNHHQALEGKINVIFLGHYHSETPGVKALGKELEKKFKVETVFIDEPTLL